MLIDTHAHPHFDVYDDDREAMMARARAAGVGKMLCVGVDDKTSQAEVDYTQNRENLWVAVGLHPHDAKMGQTALDVIKDLATNQKVVAIGECGLDYHYNHSPKEEQLKVFRAQIELALEVNKPLIFHVREAFDDFFDMIAEYKSITGVVHSFTGDEATLSKVLNHSLYVGMNGIMTFTKDPDQLQAAKACPIDRILLETDSPFLSPSPLRGKRNEPANLKLVAEFLADLRGESFGELVAATSHNAEKLFAI